MQFNGTRRIFGLLACAALSCATNAFAQDGLSPLGAAAEADLKSLESSAATKGALETFDEAEKVAPETESTPVKKAENQTTLPKKTRIETKAAEAGSSDAKLTESNAATRNEVEAPAPQNGPGEAPAAVAASAAPGSFTQFQYNPTENPERAFTITIPADWDVKPDTGGFNLFMEPKVKLVPTPENPTVADPKITVEVLRRTVFMDDKGLSDYEAEIKKQFAEKPGLGTELNVYQKLLFPVSDTRKAFVFDLTYLWNGHEIFSTVVIMASEKYMYRATLTDYKVNYSLNRDRLYPVMASIDFEGAPAQRAAWYEKFLPWSYYLGGGLVFITALQVLYIRRARRNVGSDDVDDLENLVELDSSSNFRSEEYDAGDDARPLQAPMSEAGWEPSRAAHRKSKPVAMAQGMSHPASEAGFPLSEAEAAVKSAVPPPPRPPKPHPLRETSQSSKVGSKLPSKVPTREPQSAASKSAAGFSQFEFPQSEFGDPDASRAIDNEFGGGDDDDGFDEAPKKKK